MVCRLCGLAMTVVDMDEAVVDEEMSSAEEAVACSTYLSEKEGGTAVSG